MDDDYYGYDDRRDGMQWEIEQALRHAAELGLPEEELKALAWGAGVVCPTRRQTTLED